MSRVQKRVRKPKGVQGLIELENPNYKKPSTIKAKDVDTSAKVQLSRRERCVTPPRAQTATRAALHACLCWSASWQLLPDESSSLCHGVVSPPCALPRGTREEIERQAAERRYAKLHAQGKTEQSRVDMARLAEVRARREAAAKRREQEELGACARVSTLGAWFAVLSAPPGRVAVAHACLPGDARCATASVCVCAARKQAAAADKKGRR